MDLELRQSFEQQIGERSLDETPYPAHLSMRKDQVGNASAPGDLFEPACLVPCLDADDVGTEIDGVIDGLAEVATPVERLTLDVGGLDDGADERGMERARQGGGTAHGPPRRLTAVDQDRDSIGDERDLPTLAGPLELTLDPTRDEA